jgi:hypothetical protein
VSARTSKTTKGTYAFAGDDVTIDGGSHGKGPFQNKTPRAGTKTSKTHLNRLEWIATRSSFSGWYMSTSTVWDKNPILNQTYTA